MQTAIGNAMALPWPANIPAIAQAVAAGGQIASAISGISYSGGRRYGGTVSAGNAYRINENGESEIFQAAGGQQVFIPDRSGKVIPADKAGTGKGITIINNVENYSSGAMVDTQASTDGSGNVTIQTIVTDIANGGQISQAITNYHNAPRRARG